MWCWTLRLNGGTKRSLDAAVAVEHKLYSFGGYCGLNDRDQIAVHVFNAVSLRWIKLPPVTPGIEELPPEVPSNCVCHTAVLIEYIVYLWGGIVDFQIVEGALINFRWQISNVVYGYDVDTHSWLRPGVSGAVPGGRRSHSACVLGKAMYVYGGSNQTGHIEEDIYKLDTNTMVWSLINTTGTPPSASTFHTATIIGSKMFVFGGTRHGNENYNVVVVFDTETNCWLSTPSTTLLPEGCWNHAAFSYNGELYIIGGYNSHLKTRLNDLWKFHPETFSWKKIEPKGKHPFIGCRSCGMVGDRVILFRGYRVEPSDLVILDLSPSLKTLSKLAVIQYGLEQSELPHDIRWELAAMVPWHCSDGSLFRRYI